MEVHKEILDQFVVTRLSRRLPIFGTENETKLEEKTINIIHFEWPETQDIKLITKDMKIS